MPSSSNLVNIISEYSAIFKNADTTFNVFISTIKRNYLTSLCSERNEMNIYLSRCLQIVRSEKGLY
jgi:hypothetical protein